MPKLKVLTLLQCHLVLRASIFGLVTHETLSSLAIKQSKPEGETTASYFACLMYALAVQRPNIQVMINDMDIWSRMRCLSNLDSSGPFSAYQGTIKSYSHNCLAFQPVSLCIIRPRKCFCFNAFNFKTCLQPQYLVSYLVS